MIQKSHNNQKVLDQVIMIIEEGLEKITVTYGEQHTFVRIKFGIQGQWNCGNTYEGMYQRM